MALPVFLNSQEMRVDAKLRVAIPERFMRVLKLISPKHTRKIGVGATPDRSIKLMPHDFFMNELEKWSRLDPSNSDERKILNLSASHADLLTMDQQNRIKLSPKLCEYARLKPGETAVMVGSIQFMQLFNSDVWTDFVNKGMDDFDRASDAVSNREGSPSPVNVFLQTSAEDEAEPDVS